VGGVQTMRGPVAFDKLGRVPVHEHILTMDIEHLLNYCPDFVEEDEIERAVGKLNALKASGVDTIIDLTVLGLGRYIPRIAKIAARTDLNIIVALLEAGLAREEIDVMLIDNPRRHFEGAAERFAGRRQRSLDTSKA
jgi:predicted metal-dependent phosphotriesterase family hydrolase